MKHRITSKSTLKFTQILTKNMYGLQVNPNNFGTYPINKLPERIAVQSLDLSDGFNLWQP